MSDNEIPKIVKNPILNLLLLEIVKAIIAFLVKRLELGTDDGEQTAKTEIFQNFKAGLKETLSNNNG